MPGFPSSFCSWLLSVNIVDVDVWILDNATSNLVGVIIENQVVKHYVTKNEVRDYASLLAFLPPDHVHLLLTKLVDKQSMKSEK